MAIFGGNDIQTINAYTNEVLELMLPYFKDSNLTEANKAKLTKVAPVFEQLWGSQIIQCKLNKRITFLLPEKVVAKNDTNSKDALKLTHLGGQKISLEKEPKKLHDMYRRMLSNLRKINPEVHEAIRKFTSDSTELLKLVEAK